MGFRLLFLCVKNKYEQDTRRATKSVLLELPIVRDGTQLVARINNLLDSRVSPSNESLRDSFIDLLNYSAIAIMVLDKKWPELPND